MTATAPGRRVSILEPVVVDTTNSPGSRLSPAPLTAVAVHDAFWTPRLDRNRAQTLLTAHDRLEHTGAISNFRRGPEAPAESFRGRYYSDSDVYKWVEAAAWALGTAPDDALEARLERTVADIVSAQDSDGYLNTYFTGERKADRWSDLSRWHEMYCLGHLVQAAVAHFRVTGSATLLDAALRACTLVEERYAPGSTYGACGHPNLEMALIELYRTTQDERWLRLAAWQVDSRGRGLLDGSEYLLDHAPARAQVDVTGHAVRALYLYTAIADLVLESVDDELEEVVDALWEDLVRHKTSVTGGVGARWDGEAFGDAHELPDRAYNETCAAIASILFAWRRLLRTGDGRYRDAIEHALYNAVLPGLSLSGTEFFYQNPLADAGRHRRQEWFDCACCPPNIARLLASLPGYIFSTTDDAVWVHLLVGATATLRVGPGAVTVSVDSGLPRAGHATLTLTMAASAEFAMHLPAPGWANEVTVRVNGDLAPTVVERGYHVLRRTWENGDTVTLECTLPVRLLRAHPRVAAAHHQVAVSRGPLVFCVEQADHGEVDVRDIRLDGHEHWVPGPHPELPDTISLTASALAVDDADGPAYEAWQPTPDIGRPVTVNAIPYYAWANRTPGPMRVFLPLERPSSAEDDY